MRRERAGWLAQAFLASALIMLVATGQNKALALSGVGTPRFMGAKAYVIGRNIRPIEGKCESGDLIRDNPLHLVNKASLWAVARERVCIADEHDQFREELPVGLNVLYAFFNFDFAYRQLNIENMFVPGEQQQTTVLSWETLEQIGQPLLTLDRVGVRGAQQMKSGQKLNAHSWGVPIVFEDKTDRNTWIAIIAISEIPDDAGLAGNPRTQRKESRIGIPLRGLGSSICNGKRALHVPRLPFRDTPQLVGRDPKANCSDRQNASERDKQQIEDGNRIVSRPLPEGFLWVWVGLFGGVFGIGVLILLSVDWKPRPLDPQQCGDD